MIYITGDMHGQIDVQKLGFKQWVTGKSLTKDDYLIIAGDFGLVFSPDEEEKYWLDWLDKRPWTTLFVDGNHENFPALLAYPEEEKFGGKVGVLRPSVFHLKQRGNVYTIEDKTFWCFGGAYSIDKHMRLPGISWWSEEEANQQEMEYGLDTLKYHYNTVDYVITHDCPEKILKILYKDNPDNYFKLPTKTGQYLSEVAEHVHTGMWYFGHHHMDKYLGDIAVTENISTKFHVLYRKILQIQ